MGKTFASAKGEVAKCAMTMRYYAEHAEAMLRDESVSTTGSRSGIRYDPIGAVLAVMPWNYPLWQFIRVAAPTVMAGNVMVLKHASNVPGCAKFIEDLFTRAGFPKGVVTTLFVSHDQIPRIIADPRIAAVTLTGSDRAGRSVAEIAGQHLKKSVLELGGSDPFIVASSADMDATVPLAVTARIQNNGQSCIASKRFIVVRERADEFIEKFVAAMAAVPTGDPMDPATVLGPVVSRGATRRVDRPGGRLGRQGRGRSNRRCPVGASRVLLSRDGADRRADRFARRQRGALRTGRRRRSRGRPRRRDRLRQRHAVGTGRRDPRDRPEGDRRGDRRTRRRHGLRQLHRRLDARTALRRDQGVGLRSRVGRVRRSRVHERQVVLRRVSQYYFDHAASAPRRDEVADAMAPWQHGVVGNPSGSAQGGA